jgi:hypothetical protein
LIGQRFPVENRNVRRYSIRTRQDGVPLESALANDL